MVTSGSLDETYPKEVMGYHFNPYRRVYVGSVVLRNLPGALASVAAVLGKEGVNLVASESADVEGTKTSSWGFFAETHDPYDMNKLRALIEGTGMALKIELAEGKDGIVVDKRHYPLRFNSGQQALAFRREDVVDMFSRIRKIFGSGANLVIYEMGVASGESDAKALLESMGHNLVKDNLLDLVYMYAAEGWALPEVVDFSLEPLRATIRFRDSFECVHMKSPVPNSLYLRGHLVGLTAVIFGKKTKVVETKCAAKGDPYCEFVGEETV